MERQKFSKPAATWKVENVPIKWDDLAGRFPGKSRYWDPPLKVSHSLHIWENQDTWACPWPLGRSHSATGLRGAVVGRGLWLLLIPRLGLRELGSQATSCSCPPRV